MKKRMVILTTVVVAFMGGILAIPETPEMKPSRLARHLPKSFANWVGTPEQPGQKEKEILAKDTEFERMNYRDGDGLLPSIQASIVFSGKNLSQSIHRPEVCLRAAGWNFVSEKHLLWKDVLPDGEPLPVKEILCRRVYQREDENGEWKPVILPTGEKAYLWRVFYYTFIGHEAIVSGHYQRTGEDIKDRLTKGYDQRWAYATFSSFINLKHALQGVPFEGIALDEQETKAHIQEFLRKLLPRVLAAPGDGYDESLAKGKNLGS